MITFQSLIGILKTKLLFTLRKSVFRFQSLIGILKTLSRNRDFGFEASFQSLIGILKTVDAAEEIYVKYCVSIPHRYSKDTFVFFSFVNCTKVSIPHRYSKDIDVHIYFLTLHPRFNPS